MGSQYYLNRNLSPYFHLSQGMLSQNPPPLTLLSFLLSPFLSRSPSPSGQSAGIVAVAEDDPRQKRWQLLKRFQNTKHVCFGISSATASSSVLGGQHVCLVFWNLFSNCLLFCLGWSTRVFSVLESLQQLPPLLSWVIVIYVLGLCYLR